MRKKFSGTQLTEGGCEYSCEGKQTARGFRVYCRKVDTKCKPGTHANAVKTPVRPGFTRKLMEDYPELQKASSAGSFPYVVEIDKRGGTGTYWAIWSPVPDAKAEERRPAAAPSAGHHITGQYKTREQAQRAIEKKYPDLQTLAKEPWQMTRKQWVVINEAAWKKEPPLIVQRMQDSIRKNAFDHAAYVAAAVDTGKPVPPEVLKDYPGLMPSTFGKIAKQSVEDLKHAAIEILGPDVVDKLLKSSIAVTHKLLSQAYHDFRDRERHAYEKIILLKSMGYKG